MWLSPNYFYLASNMMSNSTSRTEQDWIEALKNDDEAALRYFFELHHKSLRYFAAGLIGDDLEAEDMVSNCFVKLWQYRAQFSGQSNVKSFLYVSCRNACLDHLKKIKRRKGWQEEYLRQLEDGDERILQRAAESAYLDIISQEINNLPEKCAEVFKMLYFEHKKTDEIAALLNISVKTVRNHKARAVEQLHNTFMEKGLPDVMMLAIMVFLSAR